MAAPGWYPDPESMSRERYWDGDAWSAQVREAGTQVRPALPAPGEDPPTVLGPANPAGPAQSEPFQPFRPSVPLPDLDDPTRLPAPPPAAAPSGPGIGGTGGAERATYVPPGGSGGTRTRRRTGLIVGAVVLLVLFLVGGGLVVVLLGGDDPEPASDPSPSGSTRPPAPSESPQLAGLCDSGDPLAEEPGPDDGRVHGGGVSFEAPRGYRDDEGVAFGYGFTTAPSAVSAKVKRGYTTTYAVGSLDRTAFGDPGDAAASVLECYANGRFYSDPPAFYTPGDREELTVDGRPAVSMRGELRLDGAPIPGGDVEVVVVDTADPDSYGLFVGDQVIDDDVLLDEREQVVAGLQVD